MDWNVQHFYRACISSRKRRYGNARIFVYYHAVKMERFMRCDNDEPLFKTILSHTHFDFMPFEFQNRKYYCGLFCVCVCLFISWKMCARSFIRPLNSAPRVHYVLCCILVSIFNALQIFLFAVVLTRKILEARAPPFLFHSARIHRY